MVKSTLFLCATMMLSSSVVVNGFSSTLSSLSSLRQSYSSKLSTTKMNMVYLDKNEFELCVGKAQDTLNSDYPNILTSKPDFSIYDTHLECIDPSGVQLHGLSNYVQAFRLLHAIVGFFYCPDESYVSHRTCFDKARQNIRIHWNAKVIPKAIFGKAVLHVDGVSVYEISKMSGNITQHRVERLIINDMMIQPEQGLISALRGYAVRKKVDSIPVFNHDHNDHIIPPPPAQFQRNHFIPRSYLFQQTKKSTHLLNSSSSSATSSDNNNNKNNDTIDWNAYEQKNKYRKKFNLKPLSIDEFLDMEKQITEYSLQQQLVQQKQKQKQKQQLQQKEETPKKSNNFLKELFGIQDTCETNYDCERPEVCCDFKIKKICCTNGLRIIDGPPPQWAEIPVIAPPDYPMPPPGNGGRGQQW
mmetsp:Transcript_17517/g.49489  ORF Transcript_17517/g.49489 Transcript_17517/m.49489 type:complete len:414 (-) Transcript_17517:164-1405(-)